MSIPCPALRSYDHLEPLSKLKSLNKYSMRCIQPKIVD